MVVVAVVAFEVEVPLPNYPCAADAVEADAHGVYLGRLLLQALRGQGCVCVCCFFSFWAVAICCLGRVVFAARVGLMFLS